MNDLRKNYEWVEVVDYMKTTRRTKNTNSMGQYLPFGEINTSWHADIEEWLGKNEFHLISKFLEKLKDFLPSYVNMTLSTVSLEVTDQGGLEMPHNDDNLNIQTEAFLG